MQKIHLLVPLYLNKHSLPTKPESGSSPLNLTDPAEMLIVKNSIDCRMPSEKMRFHTVKVFLETLSKNRELPPLVLTSSWDYDSGEFRNFHDKHIW